MFLSERKSESRETNERVADEETGRKTETILEGDEITHHITCCHCGRVRRLSMVPEIDGEGLGKAMRVRAGGRVHEGREERAPVCG